MGVADALAVPAPPFSGVHADLSGLAADDHAQYALLAGRAGGQSLFGGTGAGGDLFLQGRNDAALGIIRANSPILFGPYFPSGEVYAFQYNATENITTNFIGGGMNMSGDLTFNTGTFIYESFRGSPTIRTNANPGFAAYTVMQALPTMIAGPGAGHNPLNPLILNAGPRLAQPNIGARTVNNATAVQWAVQCNPSVNGATINLTNSIGFIVAPVWNTVSGSVANLGVIIGMDVRSPAQALFGQSLGTERLTSFTGLRVANPTINNGFGSALVVAVQSSILAGTNRYFLRNLGTAQSDFGSGSITTSGFIKISSLTSGMQFGPSSVMIQRYEDVVPNTPGALFSWQWAGQQKLYWKYWTGFHYWTLGHDEGEQADGDGAGFQFAFDRIAFSKLTQADPTATNWYVAFAGPPDRKPTVGGGYADVLWTSGGDLDMDGLAMSDVSAFQINTPSIVLSGGSITEVANLYLAGMPTSVVAGQRSTLRVTGRSKLSGSVQYPPIIPAALAAGDNDDWGGLLTATPSNSGRYWARITGNATTSNLTGIDATAVQDGDTFELTNVGTENILILSEELGSVAANRILTEDGFNHVLKPDGTATIRYDGTTSRWRVTTPAGNVAPLTGFWKFSTTTTMADPGSGIFRVNNATPASVTSVAISDISFRGGDLSPILGLLASGDVIYMAQTSDGSRFIKLNITGVTDNGTWFQIDGTVGNSGTLFGNNQECANTAIFA